MIIFYVLVGVLGYLCGSVSFSVILSKKVYKNDVRTFGSGNAGATNVARVFGLKIGFATLFFDIVKLALPMIIASLIAVKFGFNKDIAVTVTAIFGILGHCFPIFFGFKGGKGVSVAAAIAFFIDYRVLIVILCVFIIVMLITKIVSVSSCIAAVALIVSTPIFNSKTEYFILGVFTAVLVIFMHRSNIKRLINGEEKKFEPKRK